LFLLPIPVVIYNTVKTWEADKDRVEHFSASSREAPLLARYIQFINDCSAITNVQRVGATHSNRFRSIMFRVGLKLHPDVHLVRGSEVFSTYFVRRSNSNFAPFLARFEAFFSSRATFSMIVFTSLCRQDSNVMHATLLILHVKPVGTVKHATTGHITARAAVGVKTNSS